MRARGYALPFVIMILLLLSVTLASLLFVLNAGARSTESMLGRRKLFYACDGLSRIAAVSAANYFATTTSPDTEELRDFICAEGGNCTGCTADGCTGGLTLFSSQTPGFSVNGFNIANLGNRSIAPLDSGPFEGMVAMQDSVDLRLGARKVGAGWKCDVTQELSLGKISMFQFFVFSDQPYTDWLPGPKMAGTGRVHANGNLCVFGDPGPLYLERATASGSIFPSVAAGCRAGSVQNGRPAAAHIAIVQSPNFDTDPGNPDPVEPTAPSAAQTTSPTTAEFRLFSTRNNATWLNEGNVVFDRHLQDSTHGVTPLRLPVVGVTTAQQGVNAGSGTGTTATLGVELNNSSSRLLVDPLAVTGETLNAGSQKFAFKADIRIINGVWFLRDPANPLNPGTPIWSDHPGTYTTVAESNTQPGGIAVGQQTLFPSGTVPKRFSMYQFNASGAYVGTSADPAAVVSYGTLSRDSASPPIWAPGHRCTTTVANVSTAISGCTQPDFGGRVLAGTRSGFRNGMAQEMFGGSDTRANTLPINVNVAALQDALASCSDGELGSHFPGTCSNSSSGRRFNGVVYVTATWPGSNDGVPTTPPGQGAIADANQPATSTGGEQTALPYPLCSGNLTATTTMVGGFKHVPCTRYTDTAGTLRLARPTSVRVFNARNINTEAVSGRPDLDSNTVAMAVLTNGVGRNGLTIATNLPMYVLGDVNLSSTPSDLATTSHWRPVLMAGDQMNLLSNAWDDTAARWGAALSNVGASAAGRQAAVTTYNMSILAGWVPTSNSFFGGGVHNFPKQLEFWSGVRLDLKGSLVIGWAAVYARWRHAGGAGFVAPQRDWGFDRHLENILNQPPGAPLFDVQSTRRWKR